MLPDFITTGKSLTGVAIKDKDYKVGTASSVVEQEKSRNFWPEPELELELSFGSGLRNRD
jgi:hypothetical protein